MTLPSLSTFLVFLLIYCLEFIIAYGLINVSGGSYSFLVFPVVLMIPFSSISCYFYVSLSCCQPNVDLTKYYTVLIMSVLLVDNSCLLLFGFFFF